MARIHRITTVIRDTYHNGFTDLQFWQGQHWISYRKASDHSSIDGHAIFASTLDRQRFLEAGKIKISGDVRDPKMVIVNEDTMAAVFPVWVGGYHKRSLQQFVAFTRDGTNFDTPVPVLPTNHWMWRTVKFNNRYYSCVYNFSNPKGEREHRTELMVSDDLLKWETISRISDSTRSLGESGMHFTTDGELWTVTRNNADPKDALLAIAKPPYTQWEYHSLGVPISSPIILEHNGSLYVAGRRSVKRDGDIAYHHGGSGGTAIWKLTRGAITPVIRFPAAGDCGYPGFIKDPAGRICFTYYSQHAYTDGIIQPTYALDFNAQGEKFGRPLIPSDVYFAELILD